MSAFVSRSEAGALARMGAALELGGLGGVGIRPAASSELTASVVRTACYARTSSPMVVLSSCIHRDTCRAYLGSLVSLPTQ